MRVFVLALCLVCSQSYGLSTQDLIDEGEAIQEASQVARWSYVYDADVPSGCRYSFVHNATVCR